MTTCFGKELFIRFTASAFCKLLSIYVFSYFPFGFEGRMWDLIVSVPDHCLSFYFSVIPSNREREAQTFRNYHRFASSYKTQWKQIALMYEWVSCIHV